MGHDTGPGDNAERTQGRRGARLEVSPHGGAALALVVTADGAMADRVCDAAAALRMVCTTASSRREAMRLAGLTRYDVVLIDAAMPRAGAFAVCEALARSEHAARVVLLGAEDACALRALRAGASDVIDPADAEGLRERLAAALRLGERDTAAAQRDRRLRSLAHRLHTSREELSGQVSGLFENLLGAYAGLSEQLDDVAMASELNGLLRQELDVESLLRTQLEFLLARLGSTNAGVFLPSQSGDYSLGAYINYDVPKESAEVMLDHLADTVAPRFEDQRRVRVIDRDDDLASALGEDAHWLADRSVMVVSCHDEGEEGDEPECLAVIVLFRKRRVGFTEQAARTLQIASDLFAQQLGRVIRVHHRHLPKDAWGSGGAELPGA